jgi:hypothetical protein
MSETINRSRQTAPMFVIVLRLVITLAAVLTYWAFHASWYRDGQGDGAGTILWVVFDMVATTAAAAFVVVTLIALYRRIVG